MMKSAGQMAWLVRAQNENRRSIKSPSGRNTEIDRRKMKHHGTGWRSARIAAPRHLPNMRDFSCTYTSCIDGAAARVCLASVGISRVDPPVRDNKYKRTWRRPSEMHLALTLQPSSSCYAPFAHDRRVASFCITSS